MKNTVKVAIAFVTGIVALLAAEGAPAQPVSPSDALSNQTYEIVAEELNLKPDTALLNDYQQFLTDPSFSMSDTQVA